MMLRLPSFFTPVVKGALLSMVHNSYALSLLLFFNTLILYRIIS